MMSVAHWFLELVEMYSGFVYRLVDSGWKQSEGWAGCLQGGTFAVEPNEADYYMPGVHRL